MQVYKRLSFILSHSEIISFIIMLGILITPLLNLGEVLALIKGDIESQSKLYTPIYVKLLKDIIMISLIFFLAQVYFKKINIFYLLLILFFILDLLVCINYTLFFNEGSYIIFGLRWIYPLFILLLGIKSFNEKYLGKGFEKTLIFIFMVHFIFQIYEMLFASTWFGSVGNFSLRNPGIFLLPNTGAFFSVIILYWMLFFTKFKKIFKKQLLFF